MRPVMGHARGGNRALATKARLRRRWWCRRSPGELFEAARRLTPADRKEDLARRTLGHALAVLKAGDVATARERAEAALIT